MVRLVTALVDYHCSLILKEYVVKLATLSRYCFDSIVLRMVTALVGYYDSLIVEEHHHDVANLVTLPTYLLNSPILLELVVKMANVSTGTVSDSQINV